MTTLFLPSFYPTTISDNTLKLIIIELYYYIDCRLEGTSLNDEFDRFYKQFNLHVMNDMIHTIETKMRSNDSYHNTAEHIVADTFDLMSTEYINALKRECLQNWKRPIVDRYHSFLQSLVAPYETEFEMRDSVRVAIFHTWRHIDLKDFSFEMSVIKIEKIYDELKRIEFDCVEHLLNV